MPDYEPHDGQHTGCPQCFAIKLRSIQFQGMGASDRRSDTKTRDEDMWAYKRLRRSGVQPQHVFGSSEIEKRADSQFEVEHHMVMSPEVRKEFDSRIADAKALLKK